MKLVSERLIEDVFKGMAESLAERVISDRVDEIVTGGVSDCPGTTSVEETMSERVLEIVSEDVLAGDVGSIEVLDRDKVAVVNLPVDVGASTIVLGVSEINALESRIAVALTKEPVVIELLRLPPKSDVIGDVEAVSDAVTEISSTLVVDTTSLSADVDISDRLSARRTRPAEVNVVRNRKPAVR